MSIANIKNKYLRRLVLLIAVIPLMVLAFFEGVARTLMAIITDIPIAFVGAWKGK